MEKQLVEVFENLHNYYTSMDSRLKGEGFKARVLKVIRAWEEWTIYQKEFLSKLKAIFLGLPTVIFKQTKINNLFIVIQNVCICKIA